MQSASEGLCFSELENTHVSATCHSKVRNDSEGHFAISQLRNFPASLEAFLQKDPLSCSLGTLTSISESARTSHWRQVAVD